MGLFFGMSQQVTASAEPTVFFEDTFNRASLGTGWDVSGLLSGTIVSNKLVTEAIANTWNDLTKGAKYTFPTALSGDFECESNLEWVARSTDFAMLYMCLITTSGERLSLGLNDSWGSEQPRFNTYTPNGSFQTGYSSEAENGSLTIKMTRVNGIVKFYKNTELLYTSVVEYNNNITHVILTNTKLTTYNGKTAKWDYIKITQ